MIERLESFDIRLFYFINGHHNTFFDKIFWTLSQHWCIAIVLVLIFVFLTLRKEPKTWWLILICIALSFLIADRISVMFFKDVFCRLRPCHVLENVHLIDGHCGGKYGFVSSHAANVFSLATIFAFIYRKVKIVPYSLFIWAILVAYSRPYLGVHYPGDVICGAILGILIGYLIYRIYKVVYKKVFLKEDRQH